MNWTESKSQVEQEVNHEIEGKNKMKGELRIKWKGIKNEVEEEVQHKVEGGIHHKVEEEACNEMEKKVIKWKRKWWNGREEQKWVMKRKYWEVMNEIERKVMNKMEGEKYKVKRTDKIEIK